MSLDAFVAGADTPLARLERVFDWHRDWFASDTFCGCMFAHAAAEFADKGCSIHEISVQQKAGLTQFIERILAGIVPAARAGILAPMMVMLLDGATLAVQISSRANAAADAWRAARALLAAPSEAFA
ncbi:hypothetical protein LFL96_17570 [Paraburkholderia sp. D15]|uniref:hypothetical protein n=1 Tax=Paraburkholderia sp. D15 TaxID=2880218 RepID=UPI002479C103|nr:hypothetical protein [Paraburkholderia sp. D15]WGS49542.1 hypothetical protein LFL96_17570 [Paraburkholderia sp. D15]